MNVRSEKPKIPAELSLAACLSAGITLVISPIYIVLCILALVYRYSCNSGMLAGATGDSYFVYTLYRVYIQTDSCGNAGSSPPAGVLLTTPDTVFIFNITVLSATLLSSAAAIALIVVTVNNKSGLVFATVWTYISICVASLIVDITYAVFYGTDFAEMNYTMEITFPGIASNYLNDVLRLGSLLFVTIALKGFLVPVINIALLIVIAIYATNYRNKLQTEEHSIHKVGAIHAYDQRVNRGFVDDERRSAPRSPLRAGPPQTNTLQPHPPLSDYSNRDYDRSNSWQHSPAPMPFSYMEEARRPRPSYAAGEQWRREPWPPAPPVPAPDYSPPARRLKSALKPNYM
ncbi:uncharacterized protein LOC125241821 isoform X2 [Leguminivora glycinivorella]|uniref:uncharacterized protein LOC125241821 isoform X2 n=1 Tax=Leguminivora glycinivorella TaxID=1035111 RepID=UPI00200D56ED|nr:uncharacterized protein LOC125241821 isoform X2 [Leguminivora glycinivorella]